MRVLMLGGTGAMGMSLAPRLLARGDEVFVTSRSKHESDAPRLHWLQGNAKDLAYLRELLSEPWDAIVDFMIYSTKDFRERYELLLASAKQYLFFSSSRVYARSEAPLRENSPRLLEACDDETYLRTDEYALCKAREEDLLRSAEGKGWTIIRPYITYNTQRLQLGVYEKEMWLYRALHGRSVVFSRDLARRYTTMTFAEDVSECICGLIGNPAALGETVHLALSEPLRWEDVLSVYQSTFERETGRALRVKWIEDGAGLATKLGRAQQFRFDRSYDRRFDSGAVEKLCGGGRPIPATPAAEGLDRCLSAFLKSPSFLKIDWQAEAYLDKRSGEWARRNEFASRRDWLEYLALRILPWRCAKVALRRL